MKPVIGPISRRLHDSLLLITPSKDLNGFLYRPAVLTLKSGQTVPRAYVSDAKTYERVWGPDWKTRSYVPIAQIDSIAECQGRLPPALTNTIYQAGESGMGYCIFTLEFNDGSRVPFGAGNAVDFPDLPSGKSPQDVVAVHPHQGRGEWTRKALDYQWALFDGIAG